MELHRGQGKEIFWRDTVTCPTEEQYKSMVIQSVIFAFLVFRLFDLTSFLFSETGGLFNLGVRLMQLFSKEKQDWVFDFSNLIQMLGLLFQIRLTFDLRKLQNPS